MSCYVKAGVREKTLGENVCGGTQTIPKYTALKGQASKQVKEDLVKERKWREFGEIVDNQIFREITIPLWVHHNKDEGSSQPLWKQRQDTYKAREHAIPIFPYACEFFKC